MQSGYGQQQFVGQQQQQPFVGQQQQQPFIGQQQQQPYGGQQVAVHQGTTPTGNVGAPCILRIVEARGLKKSDITGRCDPYCIIKFKKGLLDSVMHHDAKLMTRVVEKNLNPIWNEEFVLHPHRPDLDIIQIQVFDKDRIGADTFLGKVNLPVAQYCNRGLIDEWIPLQAKRKLNKPVFGELHLLVSYNEGQSMNKGQQQMGVGQQYGSGYGSQSGIGYGSQMGSSSGYGSSQYGTSGYGSQYSGQQPIYSSGLSSGTSGYGTSGYGSGYPSTSTSGLSSGMGSSYASREVSGLTGQQIPVSTSTAPTTTQKIIGTGEQYLASGQHHPGYTSSSYLPSSSYGSTGGYGFPSSASYGSGLGSSSGYGTSGLGSGLGSNLMGSSGSGYGSSSGLGGMSSFVNYPPPVARHQDRW